MGMSTHVIGFKPPNAKWQQMRAVWESCQAAGIDPPREVEGFFDGMPPDPNGVEVELGPGIVRAYERDMQQGYEVDVAKLPKDVTVIRFYNSW